MRDAMAIASSAHTNLLTDEKRVCMCVRVLQVIVSVCLVLTVRVEHRLSASTKSIVFISILLQLHVLI